MQSPREQGFLYVLLYILLYIYIYIYFFFLYILLLALKQHQGLWKTQVSAQYLFNEILSVNKII